MPETHLSGVTLRYDDVGNGEPALLMLPGWCGSRQVFAPLLSRLNLRHRVLAVDWRGHGQSEPVRRDFGSTELVNDALAVAEESGAGKFVVISVSHAGWIGLEMRRLLQDRIQGIIMMDWLMLEPPGAFHDVLRDLQSPQAWKQARDMLCSMWLEGVENPEEERYVREDMAGYGFEMWSRAGREIASSYGREGTPLQALARLDPPVPALHLFAQAGSTQDLQAQQDFCSSHPWFSVEKLEASGHFATFEVPDRTAELVDGFVSSQVAAQSTRSPGG